MKCKVYDESVKIRVLRAGRPMEQMFCQLVRGDVVLNEAGEALFTVGVDAHISGDATYDGWLLYDDGGNDYYPEDFGAPLR